METDTNTPRDEPATGLTPVLPMPDEAADTGASLAPDKANDEDEADANAQADAIVLEASLESFPGSDAPAWTARRGPA
jgi:hypothetical protein